MRPSDGKYVSFTGRKEGDVDVIYQFDESVKKDHLGEDDGDYPRASIIDTGLSGRSLIDEDRTSRRTDYDSWLVRKSAHSDMDNLLMDEAYFILEEREPEDPDKYAWDDTEGESDEEDDS